MSGTLAINSSSFSTMSEKCFWAASRFTPSASGRALRQLSRNKPATKWNPGAVEGSSRAILAALASVEVTNAAPSSLSIIPETVDQFRSESRFYSPYKITHDEWRFSGASAPQRRFERANCVELPLTRGHVARDMISRIRDDRDHRDCHTKAKRRFTGALSITDNYRFSVAQEPRRVDGLALHGVLKWR